MLNGAVYPARLGDAAKGESRARRGGDVTALANLSDGWPRGSGLWDAVNLSSPLGSNPNRTQEPGSEVRGLLAAPGGRRAEWGAPCEGPASPTLHE